MATNSVTVARRFARRPRWLFASALSAAVLGTSLRLTAFPPAPHYTLFGIVRDQVGVALQVEGAEIVLLRDNVDIGRAPVSKQLDGDHNYELNIKIDQNRTSTRTYSSKAVAAEGIFSVVVEMNGQRFYPIEVAGSLRAGKGGERVRLDLNLGADTDGDGLPDAWEEWQLYQAGRRPGTPGWNLALIDRAGDFDGDGTSNYLEYVAGTFAGDATERFELRLTGKTATAVAFEFYAITGKVYSIEESADLQTWSTVAFAPASGAPTTQSWRASAVGVQPAFVAIPATASRFYRLVVR